MASFLFIKPLVAIARRCLNSSVTLMNSPIEKMFYITLNSEKAYIEYYLENDVYILHHTSVPKNYEGAGIGKLLAMKTFDYIGSNGMKMAITCSYLQSVFEKNKDKYEHFYLHEF